MIRALTLGLPLLDSPAGLFAPQVQALVKAADRLAPSEDIPIRTRRLTLPVLGPEHEDRAAISSLLRGVSGLAEANGFRWYCLPLDLVSAGLRSERLAAVLAGMRSAPRMFVNCVVADAGSVSAGGCHEFARLVLDISRMSNNGFDNFRVGASCCCPPNAPFFPFSRHEGLEPAFSIAMESASIAQEVVSSATRGEGLEELRLRLVAKLVDALRRIDQLANEISRVSGVRYCGLDASFAPFPDGSASVAQLIESLGGGAMGAPGTVFVTSVLTNALQAAIAASGVETVGFNGVMFSILEDNRLAAANSRRAISLESLLAYSTVCGCGLDMVPIAGNTFPEEIAATTLDVAALALRLSKPLGVRLLPIPGRAVNEVTDFNLDFLCDSRIMELRPCDRAPVCDGVFSYLDGGRAVADVFVGRRE